MAKRVTADCRKMPSKSHCSLVISGRMDEVLPVAVYHAVKHHGHKASPALRKQIRAMLVKKGR